MKAIEGDLILLLDDMTAMLPMAPRRAPLVVHVPDHNLAWEEEIIAVSE